MNLYNFTFRGIFSYIAKRAMMLLAKILGFKSLCLVFSTFLLYKKIINEDSWLTIMIIVLCASSGIHVADTVSDFVERHKTTKDRDKK